MGRARHFRATQVYERLRRQLAAPRVAGTHEHEYRPWASALRAVPPAEVLTRTLPVQHGPAVTVRSLKRKKSDAGGKGLASLMKPQPLVYIEDELRKRFYRDHPWELARPRVVAEVDGMDARQWDWSKGLRQPGMQLSGESVVQRQKWLMENVPGMTMDAAYDVARKEFYALRHEEEVAAQVAREEARMVGGYFGKGMVALGMAKEDAEFDRWRAWAMEEAERSARDRAAAYTSFGDDALDTTAAAGEASEAA